MKEEPTMKTCPNCHSQINDEAAYCPICGTAVNFYSQPNPSYTEPPVYAPPEPIIDPYDHTGEFDQEDIAANKLTCMLVYLLDVIGIIIALLANKESMYTAFHVKQSMKFTVAEILWLIPSLLLCWTFIVPIAGVIAMVVLLVIKFISFTQVCGNKAKEPAILRSIPFLK